MHIINATHHYTLLSSITAPSYTSSGIDMYNIDSHSIPKPLHNASDIDNIYIINSYLQLTPSHVASDVNMYNKRTQFNHLLSHINIDTYNTNSYLIPAPSHATSNIDMYNTRSQSKPSLSHINIDTYNTHFYLIAAPSYTTSDVNMCNTVSQSNHLLSHISIDIYCTHPQPNIYSTDNEPLFNKKHKLNNYSSTDIMAKVHMHSNM